MTGNAARAAACLVALSGWLVSAGAASAREVRLDYGAYFLGIRLADLALTYEAESDSYRIGADYNTVGVIGWLRREQISANAAGARGAAGLAPQTYRHVQTTPRKTRTVDMRWIDGDVEATIDPARYVTRADPPVTAEDRAGALDPLSGLLQLALRVDAGGGEGCNTTIRVFNGKERYDLRGAYVDTRDVAQGGYRGPVHVCTVHYVPVAGYEPEDMPSGRFLRTPVNVWFGETEDGAVPVRLSYATGFGDLVLQARALGGAGR